MHLRRWLTALVLLPFLVWIILAGGRLGFVLLLLLVNGLGQWEFLAVFQPESDSFRKLSAILLVR